jgi:hypothetical protein
MTLEGDDAGVVLDRIQIPEDAREKISERLTPGSTLIVADESVNSAVLPKGGDYLISVKETPVVAEKPNAKRSTNVKRVRANKKTQAKAKNRTPVKVLAARKKRSSPYYYYYDVPPDFRSRRSWRWPPPYGLR